MFKRILTENEMETLEVNTFFKIPEIENSVMSMTSG